MRPPYIERSAQGWPLRPGSDRPHRLGPQGRPLSGRGSLGRGARLGVTGSHGGGVSGVGSVAGGGVMLAMMGGVMTSVVAVMTSGAVTQGEADKGGHEEDAEHVDTVMVRT